jgi:hypothetical protein
VGGARRPIGRRLATSGDSLLSRRGSAKPRQPSSSQAPAITPTTWNPNSCPNSSQSTSGPSVATCAPANTLTEAATASKATGPRRAIRYHRTPTRQTVTRRSRAPTPLRPSISAAAAMAAIDTPGGSRPIGQLIASVNR